MYIRFLTMYKIDRKWTSITKTWEYSSLWNICNKKLIPSGSPLCGYSEELWTSKISIYLIFIELYFLHSEDFKYQVYFEILIYNREHTHKSTKLVYLMWHLKLRILLLLYNNTSRVTYWLDLIQNSTLSLSQGIVVTPIATWDMVSLSWWASCPFTRMPPLLVVQAWSRGRETGEGITTSTAICKFTGPSDAEGLESWTVAHADMWDGVLSHGEAKAKPCCRPNSCHKRSNRSAGVYSRPFGGAGEEDVKVPRSSTDRGWTRIVQS